jgi:lyso-ornithine lipid O-acyltransferase
MIKTLRAIFRLIRFFLFLVVHLSWFLLQSLFRKQDLQQALAVRQGWIAKILLMLGIEVDRGSGPPPGNHLFIGNHRSYIDPIIPLHDVKALPVGKAEVATWPVIGYATKVTGVIFVKRESKSSRADVLAAMRDVLKQGYSVLVYPEGTTHVQPTTIDFRTGAFNMAAKEGFSIVPMAIDYADLGDAWVGNDTFIPHFLRCFGKKRTYVKIRYGQPVMSDDINYLVTESKRWIDENMLGIRQEFESEKTSAPIAALA